MKRTPRGFSVYSTMKDSNGDTVRVQESSSVLRRCWIFANKPDGRDAIMHLGQPSGISPHLTPAQARRLAKALLRFADGDK